MSSKLLLDTPRAWVYGLALGPSDPKGPVQIHISITTTPISLPTTPSTVRPACPLGQATNPHLPCGSGCLATKGPSGSIALTSREAGFAHGKRAAAAASARGSRRRAAFVPLTSHPYPASSASRVGSSKRVWDSRALLAAQEIKHLDAPRADDLERRAPASAHVRSAAAVCG